ncbi:FadR/GntR family transcriptional regulator [Martelella alba]|uniref:FadR family transcriptional regulator n=1 Tax=Martelella alba TaxID=2590451 RepID=A0ABY2SFI5_9HYPH|nr:GntR family transcriptional regulator [Martelella alba]TKI03730.1 FadR family transcriptional regulator [Martelella alba]
MPDKNKFTMIPIKRTDVFQTIIQQLNNLLDSGNLRPGERLPSERELSESLGVSRTSIRQALKVLEASGRLETRVGSGTYLIDARQNHVVGIGMYIQPGVSVTKDFMRQLIVARAGIERTIFEEYSRKSTRHGIMLLRSLVEENAHEFADEENDENGGLDLTFECKVAELNQNIILANLQQQIHQLWVSAWNEYGYVPEKKLVLHQEHLDIIDALAAKNSGRVVDLIIQHVDKEIE